MGIKISELNQLETPVDSDIIPIVDMDAGETKYIEFADLLGPEGPAGPAGADGEEVTIRIDGGYIQWRLGDGEWENLIAVSSLVGPQGEQGIQGPEGPAATLNWMGAWSALTEYDPLDVVSHEGVTYLCIATSTDDEPPDPVHWNAIGAGSLDADLLNSLASLMNDTVAKGAPRAQDTPDMTIYVAGFQAYINGALVSFAGGNSPAMSAPSANPRIDRVYLTDAGALAITTGDEGASPEVPALVAGTVPICLIYHRVGSVHIDDADDSTNSYIYRDDRPIFQDVTASDVVGPASSVDERIARFNGTTGKLLEDSGKLITDFADATHASRHKSGGADAIKLDELATPTDVSTLNASTSAHGLLKKLDNDPTHFMNGQGAWATPAGNSGFTTVGSYAWCDYVTDGSDDQIEINSALAASTRVAIVSDVTVGNSINVSSNYTNLICLGDSIITAKNAFGASASKIVYVTGSYCNITVNINGNSSNNNYDIIGIKSTGAQNVIQNCRISYVSQRGIYASGAQSKILNNYLYHIGLNTRTYSWGIEIETGSYSEVIGNKIDGVYWSSTNTAGFGIFISGYSTKLYGITIANNYVTNFSDAIYAENCDDSIMANNTILYVPGWNSGGIGIGLDVGNNQPTGWSIVGNNVKNCKQAIYSNSGLRNSTISGNSLTNCTIIGINIWLATNWGGNGCVKNVTISNNSIYDCGQDAIQIKGVDAFTGMNNVTIVGNALRDYTGWGVCLGLGSGGVLEGVSVTGNSFDTGYGGVLTEISTIDYIISIGNVFKSVTTPHLLNGSNSITSPNMVI